MSSEGSLIGRLLGFRSALSERDATIARQRERIRELERSLPDSDFPKNAFFVIGRARSGTTWLRSLLNAHPEILCWGEGRLFERSFERPELKHIPHEKLTPTSLYGALARSGYLADWIENSVWSGDVPYEDHLDALTRASVRHFMEGRLAGTGARLVGDKTPYRSAEGVSEIARILPGAKVIHIVRDGRDAAVSYMHHAWNRPLSEGGFYDLSPQELMLRDGYRAGTLVPPANGIFTPERIGLLAAEWAEDTTKVSSTGRGLIPDDFTEVRYEDLLEDAGAVTRHLLDFLSADSSGEIVSRLVSRTNFESGSGGRRPGEEDSGSRNRKGIAGDWKNVFTPEDTRIFEEIAGDALSRFGYAVSR